MLETGELVTDVGTILGGEDAVKYGLIDNIGSLSDALDELDNLINERRKNKHGKCKTKTANCQKNTEQKSSCKET